MRARCTQPQSRRTAPPGSGSLCHSHCTCRRRSSRQAQWRAARLRRCAAARRWSSRAARWRPAPHGCPCPRRARPRASLGCPPRSCQERRRRGCAIRARAHTVAPAQTATIVRAARSSRARTGARRARTTRFLAGTAAPARASPAATRVGRTRASTRARKRGGGGRLGLSWKGCRRRPSQRRKMR
eukprot:7384778-Prymnesium_polylepis.1